MKKAASLFFIVGTMLYGALPPLAQSVRELQAVLSDPQVQSLFGSAEAIEEVRRTEEGYALWTKSQLVLVDLEYVPGPKKVGPPSFRLHFQEPIPLGKKTVKTTP